MTIPRPLISVIMPCCNLGSYLNEAVDSVLHQTYPEFEIIVIDDGSTDSLTRELLTDYRRPRTRVLRCAHHGVMRARNVGLASATGEYVCALDADDKLDPSYFEKAVRILTRDDSITFVSCWLRTFGDEEWTWRQERCDLATLLAECTVATPSVVRRAAVLDVGGFDERMPHQGYEDWDLWISLVERGYRGTILPEVLFFYRRRAVSVSRVCEQRPDVHLQLMQYLLDKHQKSYRQHLFEIALLKETETAELLRANYVLEQACEEHQRLIELRREERGRLRAKLEIVRAKLDRALEHDDLVRQVRALETALTAAQDHVRALLSSRSWKLMAPLRAVYDGLASVRRASRRKT